MKSLKVSFVIQIILVVYFQAMLWFPLGSWNDQPGKRLITLLREGQVSGELGFVLALLLPVLLFALAIWMYDSAKMTVAKTISEANLDYNPKTYSTRSAAIEIHWCPSIINELGFARIAPPVWKSQSGLPLRPSSA
jgi:hypothetical protein